TSVPVCHTLSGPPNGRCGARRRATALSQQARDLREVRLSHGLLAACCEVPWGRTALGSLHATTLCSPTQTGRWPDSTDAPAPRGFGGGPRPRKGKDPGT